MQKAISLAHVGFGYKKTSFLIEDLSLDFFLGETAVLTGRNGSGKTTLSKLMIGILKPDKGDIFIDGNNIKKRSLAENAKTAGYLFQNPERQLFCNTVLEEVAFSLKQKGFDEAAAGERALELLGEFSMEDKADAHPMKLSGGEKQRLALLAVFAMEPKYYILDEPSSGIDRENRQKLFQMLRRLKTTGAGLCIITHDGELTEALADRIVRMEKGRVVRDEKA
jgi:energy-coupling factor transport system ATP-binding protein